MDAVQAPIVPLLGDWIRETPGTISLGQGVVHYGPPRGAIEAARAAMDDPATHEYHDGAGVPALVERITAKLAAENGIVVGRDRRVMVTAGANMAFLHAVLSITEPGDEIILPSPYYFNHDMAIEMAGCRAVRVPTDDRCQLRLDAIRAAITDRTRAVVTISPNNPTGAVLSESSLRELNALCGDRGLYHLTDEVYEYFVYGDARHASPGAFPGAAPHTISMYSLSKAYGFAGWRIGYVVYPEHLDAAMMKSQDTVLICPPIVSQIAAAAALDAGRAYCEPYVREYDGMRHLVLDALAGLGPLVEVPPADGAFYCFVRVRPDGQDRRDPSAKLSAERLDSLTLAERLIREHKVAVVPGAAFGVTDVCAFRVAFGALHTDTVAAGIGRLVGGLRAILHAS